MNTFYKTLLAVLFSFSLMTATAQPPMHEGDCHGGPAPEMAEGAEPHQGCMMHGAVAPVDFQSVKICYAPMMGAFVVVDSVECSVHLVALVGDRLDTVGSYKTDITRKRHDLRNILRPVSVSVVGPYIVVLASAVNDTAYVAFLDTDMNVVARRNFSSPMYAMHFEHGQLFVVGRNPYGYDINVLPLRGGFEAFENAPALSTHYRVAKQSEKIKQSDPIGYGLSAVAVAVVFLALICIFLILSGSGKLMMGVEERRKQKGDAPKGKGIKPVSEGSSASAEGEVYAAIAAAIHLYNDELHDEEDTVITIQKVEREWTPWNAKYYNMNQYFNNRR